LDAARYLPRTECLPTVGFPQPRRVDGARTASRGMRRHERACRPLLHQCGGHRVTVRVAGTAITQRRTYTLDAAQPSGRTRPPRSTSPRLRLARSARAVPHGAIIWASCPVCSSQRRRSTRSRSRRPGYIFDSRSRSIRGRSCWSARGQPRARSADRVVVRQAARPERGLDSPSRGFRDLVDQNCGYRGLEPGLPKQCVVIDLKLLRASPSRCAPRSPARRPTSRAARRARGVGHAPPRAQPATRPAQGERNEAAKADARLMKEKERCRRRSASHAAPWASGSTRYEAELTVSRRRWKRSYSTSRTSRCRSCRTRRVPTRTVRTGRAGAEAVSRTGRSANPSGCSTSRAARRSRIRFPSLWAPVEAGARPYQLHLDLHTGSTATSR